MELFSWYFLFSVSWNLLLFLGAFLGLSSRVYDCFFVVVKKGGDFAWFGVSELEVKQTVENLGF